MADLYLALGSNIAPRRHLPQALALLRARYPLLRVSSWYSTMPWGVTDQPWFLNCVAHAVTRDRPHEVLAFTQRIEALLGRRRVLTNGPRTIDVDLLLHDSHVCDSARLTLPHPGLRERDFMLIPLLELCPAAHDPRDGAALAAAAGTLRYRQIERRVRPEHALRSNSSRIGAAASAWFRCSTPAASGAPRDRLRPRRPRRPPRG